MLRFNVSGPYYVRFDTRSFFSSIGIVFLLGLEHETVTHIEVFLLEVLLHGQYFQTESEERGQGANLLFVDSFDKNHANAALRFVGALMAPITDGN